jgi:hypothetical protein
MVVAGWEGWGRWGWGGFKKAISVEELMLDVRRCWKLRCSVRILCYCIVYGGCWRGGGTRSRLQCVGIPSIAIFVPGVFSLSCGCKYLYIK